MFLTQEMQRLSLNLYLFEILPLKIFLDEKKHALKSMNLLRETLWNYHWCLHLQLNSLSTIPSQR